jgi:hypothetical protein
MSLLIIAAYGNCLLARTADGIDKREPAPSLTTRGVCVLRIMTCWSARNRGVLANYLTCRAPVDAIPASD